MKTTMSKKIAVLVSGGVDSSVALALLKKKGLDVTAFYLKIWLEEELSFLGSCPWEEDLKFVKQLCNQLSVPLETVNLQNEYSDKIIDLAIKQVKLGLTPNPDIMCNSLIKFGAFFDYINKKFNKVATGHYADLTKINNKYALKCSEDLIKDQTYFLSQLTQEQLSKIIFPIGKIKNKVEVREIAEKLNLPTKKRKDSQGLCFLGKIKFSDFIKANVGVQKGDFIEFETGKILGNHNGFWFYTIGQRKGAGLSGGPWYVVKKDTKKNIVYLSKNYFSKDKVRNKFYVSNPNWISEEEPKNFDLFVKIRHGSKKYKCEIKKIEKNKIEVKIFENDQGISPGQFAAFYQNNLCLGSAIITE